MATDTEAQTALPEEEIYPGTEIMHDYLGSHLTHSHNDRSGTVLIPQPSHSPDDPLNWTPFWKWTVVFGQVFFIFTSVMSALSVSPLTPVFEAQFNKDEAAIALLTSALVMITGFTNFAFVPIAEIYGRRFILIVCAAICVGSTIWHGAAQSYGSFMGARVLVGLGMSIGESLMPMVVSDVFFLHERGRYMGFYFFSLFNAMFLGPVFAGVCEQRFGTWRTFYWIITAFCGASFLLIIFVMPETRYFRQVESTASPGTPGTPSNASQANTEKQGIHQDEVTRTESMDRDQFLGRGRPQKWQFKLLQPSEHSLNEMLVLHVFTPIRILRYPIVVFGACMLAFPASGLLSVNYTESSALTAAPYLMDTGAVGLTNLAMVVGGTLGLFTAGPLSDWIAMVLTRRNNGVREPEMRLLSLIPFIICATVSLVVVGCGFQYGWPWEVVVVVGFGGIGLLTVSLATIGITYAIDSYKPVAGQIMVIATVLKNSFGFGMGYYIPEWVAKSGYLHLFMSEVALIIGTAVLGGGLFYFYGKKFRKMSRNAKVHSL